MLFPLFFFTETENVLSPFKKDSVNLDAKWRIKDPENFQTLFAIIASSLLDDRINILQRFFTQTKIFPFRKSVQRT